MSGHVSTDEARIQSFAHLLTSPSPFRNNARVVTHTTYNIKYTKGTCWAFMFGCHATYKLIAQTSQLRSRSFTYPAQYTHTRGASD